jgi:murein L,D-transpeptidase YafK
MKLIASRVGLRSSALSRTEASLFSRTGLAGRLRASLLIGVGALALAACNGSGGGVGAKAMRPLAPETVALIDKKGMTPTSPITVRIFKEESELEVWKQTKDGDYALLKTYPICRWSGELGPKVTEGDRQAPEGFYTITPGQMNPNSNYYLAFNMGYPNAYDKAWGRTGAHLMVHGDCSSSGCYAMTDEQIQEIFALGRDSFTGGQRSFQVQAYPFRMTPTNMARHRNNPNMAFWRMIKEGYDTFEITKAPPKVDVCEKRYVFNETPTDPNAKFNPTGPCPASTEPADLEQEIATKRTQDDAQVASLAPRTPLAPVKTGTDGGMHKVFLAKVQNPDSLVRTPGTLPPNVRPPGQPLATDTPPTETADAGPAAASPSAPTAEASVALATGARPGVPIPPPRPTDAPGGARSETVLFANSGAQAQPTARVASIDNSSGGGNFLTKLFGGGSEPASTASTGSSASSSSGFSLGKWFGQSDPAPAPAAAPPPVAMAAPAADASAQAAMLPTAVPIPPARPPVPAAPKPVSAASAAPRPVATAQPAPAADQPLYGVQPLPGAAIRSTGGFSQ